MVSTPELSLWAGPIIDVLLDYVGNVALCSRLQDHLDSYAEWEGIKMKSRKSIDRSIKRVLQIGIQSRSLCSFTLMTIESFPKTPRDPLSTPLL